MILQNEIHVNLDSRKPSLRISDRRLFSWKVFSNSSQLADDVKTTLLQRCCFYRFDVVNNVVFLTFCVGWHSLLVPPLVRSIRYWWSLGQPSVITIDKEIVFLHFASQSRHGSFLILIGSWKT